MSGRSVLDEAIAGSGRVGDLHHELEALQHAMADPGAGRRHGHGSSRASARCRRSTSTSAATRSRAQAREVLHGLGFDDERIDGDVGALSGGWKMRVAMARVLLGRPDVLLMDEPTNHLDIESIIWLEAFLKSRAGRAADDLARPRVHEPHRHEDRRDRRRRDHDATRATTTSTSASAPSARPTARPPTRASRRCWPRSSASSTASPRTPPRRRRCRAASRRSTRSRRSSCRRSAQVVKFDFRTPPRSGDQVAIARGRVARPTAARVVYDGLNLTIRRGERWCVMGKNGAGKTTLLKMIAGRAGARRRRGAGSAPA